MTSQKPTGTAALVTGASSGIGGATARHVCGQPGSSAGGSIWDKVPLTVSDIQDSPAA
jgi:hypothetical protein